MAVKSFVNFSLIASGKFYLDAISVNHSIITPPNTYIRYANEHIYDRFVCIVSGKCRFDIFNDNPINASAGDVIYIPYNIAYRTEWADGEKGEVYSFNYSMKDFSGHQITICPEIQKFDSCDLGLTRGLFKDAHQVFAKEDFGFELKCKYLLLKLFHTITSTENKSERSKIKKAIHYINTNFTDDISIDELAKMCNLGECMFRRSFKLETGESPLKYRNRLRIEKAYELLVSEGASVTKAMELTGFYDASYFNKTFKAHIGKSPSEIKRKVTT